MGIGFQGIIMILLLLMLFSGCQKKKSILKSNEEIFSKAMEKMEKGRYRSTLEILKDIGIAEEVSKERAPHVLISTADANFYLEDMLSIADAAKSYSEFVTFYSDHALAPYAQYQIGMCYYNLSNSPENDQSQTFKAIEEFRKVKNIDADSSFVRAANAMIGMCQEKIAEHEYLIGKFYYKRRDYYAASERFREILNRYESYPEKEKIYFYLGNSLLKLNNSSEGQIYLDKLVQDYPDSKYARDAREILNRKKG
jgi:outer membrane protein assembly factor BamD